MLLAGARYGLYAIDGHRHAQRHFLQQDQGDLPIYRFVFDEQYSGALARGFQPRLGRVEIDSYRFGRLAPPLLEADRKPERAAHARRTDDADFAPHQLGELPGDRQPEAGAAVVAGNRVVSLLKNGKQLGNRRWLNADARVLDRKAEHFAIGAVFERFDT